MRELALVVAMAACGMPGEPAEAVFDPVGGPPPMATEPVEHQAVCAGPGLHCMSRVVTEHGAIKASAVPMGLRPVDLQSAYHVDPTLGAGVAIGLVDAYSYPALEADLAAYRTMFALPPCTVASGCLTIVNELGETSPLPGLSPPGGEDWTIETALDVDMVSAVCPACSIIVVQTTTNGPGLYVGVAIAAKLGAVSVSNSWGTEEFGDVTLLEGNFNEPGVAVFASSGDDAFVAGPQYPATSAYVIAVGGTSLVTSTTDPRGWTETAWSDAGSSCSTAILQPMYQAHLSTGCDLRAASDISAVADPQTGLAVYNSTNGGWISVGGTSAASPIAASIFAAADHGDATPEFAYTHTDLFNDVVTGSNGSCLTRLCNAGVGWDGPTGIGTPDQSKLVALPLGPGPALTITYPPDNATLAPGFGIGATVDASATHVDFLIDGTKVSVQNFAPYLYGTPTTLADGAHTIQVIAYDESHDSTTAAVTVTVGTSTDSGDSSGGGCAAGGAGSPLLVIAFGLIRRRDRNRRPTPTP